MPHTPDDMLSAVSQSLAARTGRSLPEWLVLVEASGLDPLDQNAVRGWLRREYGVPQNSQWAIADAAARSAGWVPPTVQEYLDRQYAGAKAALRPVYESLAAAIGKLGDDVSVEGRGSYIPFVRGRQFAAIAAAARDRVDLGLRFSDPPQAARLQPGGGPGQATPRCRCGTRARSTPRSRGCCGWPTSRTPDPAVYCVVQQLLIRRRFIA
jgi:Domain of unknown function (DUF5655)